MKENYTICNCKKVTFYDIADVLAENKNFADVLEAFEDVKKVTRCSTGCGGCHDKVLAAISELLMGSEKL